MLNNLRADPETAYKTFEAESRLQLKPAGKYTKEVEAAGAPAKLAELERRRAVMKSPAQTIVEEFSLETFETKYGMSTCLQRSTSTTRPRRIGCQKIERFEKRWAPQPA